MSAVTVLVLLAAACSVNPQGVTPGTVTDDQTPAPNRDGDQAQVPVDEPPDAPDAGASEENTSGPDDGACRRDAVGARGVVDLTGRDAATLAVEIAVRTRSCAAVVVIAADDATSLLAVPVAVAADAPLLLARPGADEELTAALRRLGADEIVVVGGDATPPATGVTQIQPLGDEPDGDHTGLALAVIDHLGAERLLAVPEDDLEALSAAATRLVSGDALLPVPADNRRLVSLAEALPVTASLTVHASTVREAAELADRLLAVGLDAEPAEPPLWGDGAPTTWLVDPADGPVVAVSAAAALSDGGAVLPMDPTDLRAHREGAAGLAAAAPERTVLTGEPTAEALWQLDTVLEGPQLPGGGFVLFEEHRIVALYGHPDHPWLGALGHQELEEAVEHAQELARSYATSGTVLPAFALVASYASSEPEPTGDYSHRTDRETLRRWVKRAGERGLYVVLVLQPGRSDVLTQARELEGLLREPHVGLAIEPRWQLGEDQRHLEQVGSVSADELQLTLDWLATLTREARLPQKLVVVHQSEPRMLPERDTLTVPSELAVVISVDRHGTQAEKAASFAALTGDAEQPWLWGWHNRYEDDPVASPEWVLGLEPTPVFVAYE